MSIHYAVARMRQITFIVIQESALFLYTVVLLTDVYRLSPVHTIILTEGAMLQLLVFYIHPIHSCLTLSSDFSTLFVCGGIQTHQ